jgi:4,5-DOPA dioxygenase extradiol
VPLVYDFGGFPQHYYQVQYRAPGAPALADRIEKLMPDHERVARTGRGLDHGAYVPLTVMYPEADIPVLQMSLPTLEPDRCSSSAGGCARCGTRACHRRITAFSTLGLPFLRDWGRDARRRAGRRRFDAGAPRRWVGPRGAVGRTATSAPGRPGLPYAHPTIEHCAPMFLTLGASGDPEQAPDQPSRRVWMGLAKAVRSRLR